MSRKYRKKRHRKGVRNRSFYSRFSTWIYILQSFLGEYFYRNFYRETLRAIQVHEKYKKIQYQGFYAKEREKQIYWILHKNLRNRGLYQESTEVQVLEKISVSKSYASIKARQESRASIYIQLIKTKRRKFKNNMTQKSRLKVRLRGSDQLYVQEKQRINLVKQPSKKETRYLDEFCESWEETRFH